MYEKIIEALQGLIPGEKGQKLSEEVKAQFEAYEAQLKAEYEKNIEEAYEELSQEKAEVEKVAYEGYHQAYAHIQHLKNKLDLQAAEFEKTQKEEYEEAYQMILAEKAKAENIEKSVLETYNGRLKEMEEFYIDRIDQFLEAEGQRIYEQARRDVIADPRTLEHKLTLDKIVETVQDFISDEDYSAISSSKIEAAQKANEELKTKIRILEHNVIRKDQENKKLFESVKHQEKLLNEAAQVEKKERVEKAKNVQGKGNKVVLENGEEVISEGVNSKPQDASKEDKNSELYYQRKLSGIVVDD